MTLNELRNWLREHELTKDSYHLSLEEDNAVSYLKDYLISVSNKPADHTLSTADLYKLITHIPLNSSLPLICLIKSTLDSDYFFEIYNILNNRSLITPANFQIIYELPFVGREFLYELFCNDTTETSWTRLTAPILAVILNRAMRITHPEQSIIECFKLLDNNECFTSEVLQTLEIHEDRISLLRLFKLLLRNSCFNETTISAINQLNSLSISTRLLLLLEKNGHIHINSDLISSLFSHEYKEHLLELVDVLVKSKEFTLTADVFSLFLNQKNEFFYNKIPLLGLLQQHKVLDNNLYQLIISQDDDLVLQRIFNIMAASSLLQANHQLIAALIANDKNRYLLYPVLRYLQQIKVLNQELLISTLANVWEKHYSTLGYDVFDLYILLQKHRMLLTVAQYQKVSVMSKTDVPRLHRLVTNLAASKQLNSTSMAGALELITTRLPHVEPVTVVKDSRKNSQLARSQLMLENGLTLFAEHGKHYEEGTYGTVKKLYDSIESKVPVYSIKKLNSANATAALSEAAREVKYNRLMGRQAYYFWHNGHAKIVTEWQSDRAIHLFHKHELMRAPLAQRLKCLSSGLADLWLLHKHYRVHNDVKCQNFILSLEQGTMKLIDFGGAHKRGSFKSFAYTLPFQDPERPGEGFGQDMYGMGFVTMYLFPELYTVTIDLEVRVRISKKSFTIQEEAILNLVDSMMHSNSAFSCTSNTALDYCNQLISCLDHLDKELLDELIQSTLQHQELTAADIFCEYMPKSY